MPETLCVYCSSSNGLSDDWYNLAGDLGRQMTAAGYDLVYGGGNVGLMGALAESVKTGGGNVIGVIPEKLHRKGLSYAGCDELVVTRDLRERKAVMEARADAFIALPGGFGTLEEILEVLALKQLEYHNKPIVLINHDGYFNALQAQFETAYERRVIKRGHSRLYHFARTPAAALAHIQTYEPPDHEEKWFTDVRPPSPTQQ